MSNNKLNGYEHIEGLSNYFNDISKYSKRLTRDEEVSLALSAQGGDKKALDTLVKHNLRFVITIAKKYRSISNVSFDDLISEGNLGLIRAVYKFDTTRNVKFSSCAIWWIKAYINDYISNYNSSFAYETTDDENLLSIYENNAMYDEVDEDFEKKMNNISSRRTAIDELTTCLEEREKKIIMLFYGLGEYRKEMNLDEISREMSLTKERVRQIKDMALVKLRCEALCSNEFNNYRELV